MGMLRIPESYKYTCDVARTAHRELCEPHYSATKYTNDRPPGWAVLVLHEGASAQKGILMCPVCVEHFEATIDRLFGEDRGE